MWFLHNDELSSLWYKNHMVTTVSVNSSNFQFLGTATSKGSNYRDPGGLDKGSGCSSCGHGMSPQLHSTTSSWKKFRMKTRSSPSLQFNHAGDTVQEIQKQQRYFPACLTQSNPKTPCNKTTLLSPWLHVPTRSLALGFGTVWVESSHWADGKHFLLWLHDHTTRLSVKGIMGIFSWLLQWGEGVEVRRETKTPALQMVPLCSNSYQFLQGIHQSLCLLKPTQSLSCITKTKNMLWISLLSLTCFINNKKFQQQRLAYIIYGV